MKKLFSIFLVVIMMVNLTACKSEEQKAADEFIEELEALLEEVEAAVDDEDYDAIDDLMDDWQDMTEDYEKRWAWTERWGDVPLRRPWEHLLRVEPERAAPKAAGRQPPALVADHYQLTMFDIMAAPKEATA